MSKICWIFLAFFLLYQPFQSQAQPARKPVISGPVDDGNLVVLSGSRHRLIDPRLDVGAVTPGLQMSRILLALAPSQEQSQQIQELLDRQQQKGSSDYHHWLTPEDFGLRFGPTPQDIAAVQAWLERQGLHVTALAKSGLWMELSGSSAQVERAFHTQMRQYKVNGEVHIANATDISIPAAVAPVVRGVVSLHNFFKKAPDAKPIQARINGSGTYTPISPNATFPGSLHALVPGDYAKIYDLTPLYNSSLNGAGVQIGLVGRSDINSSDFFTFRSITNLPPGTVNNILTLPPDPGFDPNSGDSIEATLDSQWAGAVAPGATINMIVSSSTITTDGVDLSSAYAVDHNSVDVLSVSFGACELDLGPAENTFFTSLWQQAAAQGMSVFVSTGDSGAAGCDPSESTTAAVGGLAVSGLASTPFNTAVGGTQFNEAGNNAVFWSATNGVGLASANGYIPETVWNETCNPTTPGSPCAGISFFLDAGSGGKSTLYGKPTWQAGFPAAPNTDTSRDIPDVSLSAAGHDGYIICFADSCGQGQVGIVGGTSASSPSFAGIMAIVVQALGRQGLPNYALYRLAKGASASCSSSTRTNPSVAAPASCIFNDVTTGNNSVPGLTGFNATSGFDLATGLGSVNAANLVTAWRNLTSGATSTTLDSNGNATLTAAHGTPVPLSINVTGPGAPAPTGAVALNSSLTGIVDSVALTSPSASATASFGGSLNNLPGGSYSLTAHYPGDSLTAPSTSGAVSVTITPEASSTSLTVFGITGQGQLVQGVSFPYGNFINLHAVVAGASGNGVATGAVDYKDSGTLITSAGMNTKSESDLFFLGGVPVPLPPGTHSLTASYNGDASFNTSASAPVNVTITKGNPTVSFLTSSNFVVTEPGTVLVGVAQTGPIALTGTVQLLENGVPLGTPGPVSGASNQATLTATFANEGTHSLTASYSGDATYNAAVSAAFPIVVAPPFGFGATTPQGTSATVAAGQTATYDLVLTAVSSNGPTNFSGTVALTCSGAPAGTTCSINPTSLALSTTSTSVPFTVTVATTTSASLHKLPLRGLPIFFAAIFGLAISMKGSRKRLWQTGAIAVLALGISSCGGGGSSTPPVTIPPPSTHATIVVTGTSGTHVNTVNLNLTITH